MIAHGLFLAAVFLAFPAFSKDPSLGDLHAELDYLRSDLQSLRAELISAGHEGYKKAGGDQALDRINAMERQIESLTNQTEKLENRIHRIVDDGTRRIADIEFRLCEMEESCDLGALTTQQIGGQTVTGTGHAFPVPQQSAKGVAVSVAEQADFDAALQALTLGQYIRAADMFGAVAQNHAGGPLTAEALYMRGMALEHAGQDKKAGVAWLEGFTVEPNGPRAAESLLGMARVIAAQGDPAKSCLYLAEIPVRFPNQPQASEAENQMQTIDCDANLPSEVDQGFRPEDAAEIDPEFAADIAAQE